MKLFLFVALVFVIPNVGLGSPIRKVVIVRPGIGANAWPAAEDALQQELSLLDLEVEVAGGEETDAPPTEETLLRIADQHAAFAAVTLSRSAEVPSRIEVVIYETADRTVTTKQWMVSSPNDPDASVIAGIRAAEAVRACFREPVPPVEAMTRAPSAPPPPVRTAETPSRAEGLSRIAVGGGACLAASFRDTGVQSGFLLVLLWHPLRFFGVALDGAYLPFGKRIEGGGTASLLDLALFRARLTWQVNDKGRLRAALLAGGGSLMVFAEGVGPAGQQLTKDLTKVGYVGGGASLSLVAAAWLHITVQVGIGAALPSVTLSHGDTAVATLARPLLDAALQAEFGRF